MSRKWERSEAVIAQRMGVSQIGGFTSKKIRLSEGEAAILENEGDAVSSFGEGTHKVSGFFSGSGKDVVFMDKSPKSIRRDVKELWTKDDKEINAALELMFRIADEEKVRKLMMGRRNVLTIDDVWRELEREVASSVIEPVVKGKDIDDIQGDRKVEKEIQVAAEVELKKKFEVYGLDLLSFSVKFMLPGEYQEYIRRRGRMKEDSEKEEFEEEEETRKAVHERDVEEIKGAAETRESVKDDMERERIRREAEMGIEEEETQEDMKDAMEALKLKEIKDKQKLEREAEKKELGLESLKEAMPAERGRLEERYDSIKSLIGAAEKKYLQRKIDKEAFKKLMHDYEKEKAEIEVRIEKEKKKGG